MKHIVVDVSTEMVSHVLANRGLAKVGGNLYIDNSGNYYKLMIKTESKDMTHLEFFRCAEHELIEGGVVCELKY